jgi:hypothetical protein
MNMLAEFFEATDPRLGLPSACGAVVPKIPSPPMPGCYNDGLLSLIDAESGNLIMQKWWPIVGKNSVTIAITGFGDVFYCHSNGVSFLEVQRGPTEFIATEVAGFLGQFLTNPDVLEKVLRRSQFGRVVAAHGPLAYSKVYILEPWLMLGGADEIANYKKGKVDVYLDLVGQTLSKKK